MSNSTKKGTTLKGKILIFQILGFFLADFVTRFGDFFQIIVFFLSFFKGFFHSATFFYLIFFINLGGLVGHGIRRSILPYWFVYKAVKGKTTRFGKFFKILVIFFFFGGGGGVGGFFFFLVFLVDFIPRFGYFFLLQILISTKKEPPWREKILDLANFSKS